MVVGGIGGFDDENGKSQAFGSDRDVRSDGTYTTALSMEITTNPPSSK